MLKLYEKSHIKHLPGYGRVWYGFCLNVKGFNEAQARILCWLRSCHLGSFWQPEGWGQFLRG